MLFTTVEFLIFLAILFIAYYLIPKRFKKTLQWKLLLIASVFFYYLTGVGNLIYLGITIVTTFIGALLIDWLNRRQFEFISANKAKPEDSPERLPKDALKAYKKVNKNKRLWVLVICLLLNFGMLTFVKVSPFAILGISFYIFRSVSFLIDLHRGKFKLTEGLNPDYEEPKTNQAKRDVLHGRQFNAIRDFLKFALYVSFFPVLLQGPITRFDESGTALFKGNCFDFRKFSFGIQRILWGVFKKLVIADRLAIALITLIQSPEQYRGIYALMAFFFYAIVLYADFTGGIDITIGIGQALGIPMKENFVKPFFARNIAEYWRRWHITMGTWFRDYLFYPFSVCKPMLKFGGALRKRIGGIGNNLARRIPVHLATLVAWFATGIWHGISWNFIVWGLINGVIIVISTELEPLYNRFNTKFPNLVASRFYTGFEIFRTFWLMNLIRSFDLYSVRTTVGLHLSIFTDFSWGQFTTYGVSTLGLQMEDYIVIGAALLVLFISAYIKIKLLNDGSVREWLALKPMPFRFTVYGVLLFGVIIFGVYGFGYDAQQFIYTQF
ncbi:MAG: MBOAT family protein [Oscillospiraceae bacterium]|nr:MBOAT family protein [Oscillospiraceae bacterium]